MKTSTFRFITGLILGLVLGVGGLMFFPAADVQAVPGHGEWAKYYGQSCQRVLVGGWSTDCDGNYSSWGQVTSDAEYGQDWCP